VIKDLARRCMRYRQAMTALQFKRYSARLSAL